MEMQCYCDKCDCNHYTDYMHHHDWSSPEDFCCDNCVEVCHAD
jgi:hypothetical protein